MEVGEWVLGNTGGITAFYDIDTPVTVAKLEQEDYEYLNPDLISKYDLYLSFSGGPVLDIFTSRYGSPKALPLYCSVDPDMYLPEPVVKRWDLGYLGTYSDDRQPPLRKLLIDAARQWAQGRFVVAGPQYPATIAWPRNVKRFEHLPPAKHRHFYNEQRFTLNITRADMIKMGYSPSVRLFEAAACAVPVISDSWEGLDTFFLPGEEILIAESSDDTIHYLNNIADQECVMIGERARQKVLKAHTGTKRAEELERYVEQIQKQRLVV